MRTHDVDGLDAVQAAAERIKGQIGYCTLNIEQPWHQVARIEWSAEAFQAGGWAEPGADDLDLPGALVRWVDQQARTAADVGQEVRFRVRLYPPKGGSALAQPSVVALPIGTEPEEGAIYTPGGGSTDDERRAIAQSWQDLARERTHLYRDVIAQWREIATASATQARESQENVRHLFDAHVRREIGVVQAQKEALQAEREAQQSESITDELGRLAMRVMAAARDLPPELGDVLTDAPEVLELIRANPAALKKLRDPTARQALLAILETLETEAA